jgi:hypothetical protein
MKRSLVLTLVVGIGLGIGIVMLVSRAKQPAAPTSVPASTDATVAQPAADFHDGEIRHRPASRPTRQRQHPQVTATIDGAGRGR